jgi:hypothetical protein
MAGLTLTAVVDPAAAEHHLRPATDRPATETVGNRHSGRGFQDLIIEF